MIPEDFHLENRYYYSRLNTGEKDFYKFLVELYLKRERKYTFAWKGDFIPDIPEVQALPSFVWGGYGEFVDFTKVHEAVNYDCPEFFYFCQCGLSPKDDFSITVGGDEPMYTDEEIDHLEGLLWGIYHNFDHITDPFELELAIHDYITYNFDYDRDYEPMEGVTYSGRDFEEIFTVAGLLKKGKGVCAAFASLFQFVFQRRGYEVVYVVADAGEEGDKSLHAWNAIKLGQNWYHLDVTWNEDNTLDNDFPQYVFFNVTDEEIRADHDFKAEEYPEIVCNSTEYNYYHKKGLYFTTHKEIREGFGKFLEEHAHKEKNMHFYFRTPADFEEKVVSDALAREAKERGFSLRQCLFTNYDGYFAIEIFPDVFPEREEKPASDATAAQGAPQGASADTKPNEENK